MKDYITFTINTNFLNQFIDVLVIMLIFLILYIFADLLQQLFKDKERQDEERKLEPYKRHYYKLLDKEKYKEALEYAQKYKIQRFSYYN